MKLSLSLILFFLLQVNAFSQTPNGAVDTFSFSEIVVADSMKMEMLYRDAKAWLTNQKETVLEVKDSLNGKLSGQSSFWVYSQSGILKKISGRITYMVSIEVKDKKYRYLFSDFVFHYYKVDRYYKTVATGKTKPLEDEKASGWQKLWDEHKANTKNKITNDVKDLKENLKFKVVDTKAKKKEVEW